MDQLVCPRCGMKPQDEFKTLAPVVHAAFATGSAPSAVRVLRHAVPECGRWVWVWTKEPSLT